MRKIILNKNRIPIEEANCYDWAMNNPEVDGKTSQPGVKHGRRLHRSQYTCKTVSERVIQDTDAKPTTVNGECSKGYRRVDLVVDPGVDYHFYRQEPDGSWSHKRGKTKVYKTDASNKIIKEPFKSNMDYGNVNYKPCMSFCVKEGRVDVD